jgi:hypothetical protein
VNDAPSLAYQVLRADRGPGLSTVSGGFSITGMTSILVGAFLPVIGMGVALEVGKLAVVAWRGQRVRAHGVYGWRSRSGCGPDGSPCRGCYGFLAKAHIGHQVRGARPLLPSAAPRWTPSWKVRFRIVADLYRRIAQIDAAVGRTNPADRRRNLAELAAQRDSGTRPLPN